MNNQKTKTPANQFANRFNQQHNNFQPFSIILIFIIILLFTTASSCNFQQQPKEVNYYVGIKGMEMMFLETSPPKEVYEEATFPVTVYVENKGAFDVIDDKYGILSFSFDPFYIELFDIQNGSGVTVTRNSMVLKGIQLRGKSRYSPSGTESFLSFPNFRAKSVMGQREMPFTQISSTLCYPYTTTLSQIVCVDLNIYGENQRTQICTQNDLSFSDQGAPVAITLVEVENHPVGNNMVRPVFTIHLQNKGSGTVLTPYDNPAEMDRVCSFHDLYREDFNTVRVDAILSNDRWLECTPNPIRLYNNEGFTRCQVTDEGLIMGYQNYQTPLTITLSYIYLTSISKRIDIKRLNPYGEILYDNSSILPYEVSPGVIRCNYCASNQGGPGCQPDAPNSKTINFQIGFSCQCSFDTCSKLYPDGLCVPFAGYCPGASYCCMIECKSNEIRNPADGKCYPKCTRCYEATRTCACGTGTDPNNYVLMESGKFCCPITKQVYDTKDACSTPSTNCPTSTSTSSTILG
ncbi:hypothetical protein JXB28_03860 [Candidatus Woesearchaeota archaeon]|nr:hypothetical protein [Candidatus Woesearchaeota archaeon]